MPVGTADIFFLIFRVLKLNCSFPKIYHKKSNIILRVFFHFCLFVCFVCLLCLFVLFVCLFFCFLVFFVFFFSFGLFVVILLFCDKHYVLHRLQTKLINATSHCRHEKSRRGHLFHPFLTFHISNPVISMFIIFADLKRREKQHFIIYF